MLCHAKILRMIGVRMGAASSQILATLSLLFVAPLQAQTNPAAQAAAQEAQETLRRLQERQEQLLQQQRAPTRLPDMPAITTPPLAADENLPDTPCFPMQTILLDTPTRFAWLAEELREQVLTNAFTPNTCIGPRGLARLVKQLGNYLLQGGYLTSRVLLPEQDLSRGQLTLTLQTGTIEAYRLDFANPKKSRWLATNNIFPGGIGDLLNLRDLEQGLEQLRRLHSEDADLDLQPGTQLDSTIVVIKIPDRKPWRVWMSMDDAGSKATGKENGSIGLSLDSPLRLHDQLIVSYSGDLENENQRGNEAHSISYSIPFKAWLLSLSGGRSRYRQQITGLAQALSSSGFSATQDAKLTRTLWRDQTTRISAYGRLFKRRNGSFIQDTEIISQRQHATLGELGLALRQLYGRWQIDANAGYRYTLARQDGINGSNAHYSLSVGDLNAVAPFILEFFGKNWRGRYSTQMRGQQAVGSNIAGSDFFSIGTRYTVRGFDGQRTLNAENGWYWRNELALGVLPGVEIYAGLDSGAVAGPSTALLVGTKLTGSVVGVRWNPWSYLSLEGFIGMPIEFPDMPNGGSFISSRYNPGFNLYVQY